MTSSHSQKQKVHEMEIELGMYWRTCKEGCAKFRIDPYDPELNDYRDEIEVMAEMTDWPLLRETLCRSLALDDQLRIPLLGNAVAC